ncbi:universal stress protein [Litoribacter ruber]|uniref:Universal stress protein n=1 Tax=Litoribacter ruber TaxID=702568 RepID=A0AAP2G4V6_9BACT|nr:MULTISPECIES: universal stress protein [Litoribacter]MBS9524421.1 universal stress protein [Litoribacter alkaliphilus]MBT0809781.1 universal stress protein [Litoribacter ruber]
MKSVLYATDFSENAERALPFAIGLAEAHDAELFMVHILPKADDTSIYKASTKLKSLFHSWGKNISMKVHYMVEDHKSNSEGLLRVIDLYAPGLVVVGSKGGGLLKETIMGSTTKTLIRKSKSPVMAVPKRAAYVDFKEILYTLDYHKANVQALQSLLGIFRGYEPAITVVHVKDHKEEGEGNLFDYYRDELQEKIAYPTVRVKQFFASNIYEELHNHIKVHPYDLVVMVEKERSNFLDRLFEEDLVQKMESDLRVPLLSFSEKHLV